MKVKELRNWLADLGEKNMQHNVRGQRQNRTRTSNKEASKDCIKIERKLSLAETSPTSSRDGTSPRTQIDDMQMSFFSGNRSTKGGTRGNEFVASSSPIEDPHTKLIDNGALPFLTSSDDVKSHSTLPLKTNSSADPTATTRDESTVTSSEVPHATGSWDSTLISGGSWADVEFLDPEPCLSSSPTDSFDDDYGGSMESGGFPKISAGPNFRPEYYSRGENHGGLEGLADMGHDHLTLLQKQSLLMTHSTPEDPDLDDTPGGEPEMLSNMHDANIFGNRTLTAGTLDFICNDGNSQRMPVIRDHALDSSEDDKTMSSDGSPKPSIAPGALDSNMAQLFLGEDRAASRKGDADKDNKTTSVVPRRKTIDPKQLSFLQPKAPAPKSVDLRPRSFVSDGIYKFGGPKKKIVERRKEQLEQLWSESKSVTHTKKVKWGVCQRSGAYKKKVVIDVQKK